LFAAVFLIFAKPEILSLTVGGAIAIVGLLIRAWSSGHIRKNQNLAISVLTPTRATRFIWEVSF
jgi:hypothetical protein